MAIIHRFKKIFNEIIEILNKAIEGKPVFMNFYLNEIKKEFESKLGEIKNQFFYLEK